MKSHATFRRHPFGEVIARTNEDRHPLEVIPNGRLGGGLWTGHPIGLVVVAGLLVIGLVGIPVARLFFGAAVIFGGLVGYIFWRRQQ
jgi:hypothetical protein